MGTAIVVASGKGGTGKTSFTGGVASCLAALGHKTLCLDADAGLRNLDITLGMTDRAVMDFSDVAAGRCPLEKAAAPHPVIKGLYLLTAPVRLRTSDCTPEQMARLLSEIKENFDFCLLDAPAGLGSGFRLAATHADQAIVVTVSDASSLRDAQRTVMELEDMGISHIRLVVNRVQQKLLRQLDTTIDDAMDTAGLPLLGIVPEDENVLLAANRGEPLILHSRRGAAVAYFNIARRLTGERVPLMKIR